MTPIAGRTPLAACRSTEHDAFAPPILCAYLMRFRAATLAISEPRRDTVFGYRYHQRLLPVDAMAVGAGSPHDYRLSIHWSLILDIMLT